MHETTSEKYLLYAEDDVDDQHIMKEMIENIDPNLQVITVNDGLEVIQFLNSLQPNAVFPCFIVLDINMPLWDGLRTLQALKAEPKFHNIPVIMFSTSKSNKDVDRAMQLGAQTFITKPIHSRELQKITEQFSDYCHELPVQVKSER